MEAISISKSRLGAILDLTKARLTAAVTLSTATGYLLAAGRWVGPGMVRPVVGAFWRRRDCEHEF